ncbi:LytR/AlgR family response regulator transcription factor [Gemmatimonadota bacterium]
MNRIRVLVVDDEPLARSGLIKLCGADPDLELVGECADGRAAVAAICQIEPDLLLLDIQMPEMDGFEVLHAVGAESMPHVIFVTAYDQFAVQAFEVHALDYLLKPFDDERFFAAIERAKQAIRGADLGVLRSRLLGLLTETGLEDVEEAHVRPATAASAANRRGYLTRIAVKETGRVVLVRVDEIDWVEAANYCAKLHTRDRVHIIRESLKALELQLDPTQFFRVSRSAIVNLDRIQEIQPYARGSQTVILKDGTRVTMSRSRREALEHLLGQPL